MKHHIAILIMAAGKASRFGACKQLQRFGDSNMLQKLVDEANAIFDPVTAQHTFVVTGCYHQAISERIEHANFIYNPHWERGLGASIAFGVSALSENQAIKYDGLVIVLADQIAIHTQQLTPLLRNFTGENIVCAYYAGTNGVPALFPRRYFTQLQALMGDKGAKRLLNPESKNTQLEIVSIRMPEAGVDIDTPDDFREHIAKEDPMRDLG
ncbi:MAG: Unknown protein [uncultured Thiotrichaceae bacterium]|uniref:MobA-like NTP transferase domain-containing protein n=1 Tax=uncultured Thiotrichaceae bacterium TaxID=298394 RepID=A0A6S6SRF7_9GAMM|nr:MAG: Unknown protein [uncultured Thiotrichaceae bacterium]